MWENYIKQLNNLPVENWENLYNKFNKNKNDLVSLMILIHPENYNHLIKIPGISDPRGNRYFDNTVFSIDRNQNKCDSIKIFGYICPLKNSDENKINIDHLWPFSLGGPTEVSNGIFLCKIHNNFKHNDIHNIDENLLLNFTWLEELLSKIKNLKNFEKQGLF
ncbi:MAG: HNH endonuclease [Candidatus Heimdallarchaeota archaeon]|nr:HNH endonuclease [Candidatus Heimdallarchaeota archaeon]MDH5647116.1 HNH endonuclease [Candidatus Heimdallarchaeota archaeon]